jgi:cobyrinic acid a,c-diamide synthase
LRIGYRTATAAADNLLDTAGTPIRAYAFHYAVPAFAAAPPAYVFADADPEGVATRSLVSSFLHRHFLPGDGAIVRYVRRCTLQAR